MPTRWRLYSFDAVRAGVDGVELDVGLAGFELEDAEAVGRVGGGVGWEGEAVGAGDLEESAGGAEGGVPGERSGAHVRLP